MAKKKRPGLKAPSGSSSVASGFSRGESSRHGMDRGRSTRSGMTGRSGHTAGGGKSVGSADDVWGDETDPNRPGLGRGKAGQSMRSFLKTANSVGSGLGIGANSGHKLTHKQKKARPGLAIAPQGMSTRSGLSGRSGHLSRNMSTRSGMSSGSGHRSSRNLQANSPANSEHNDTTGGRPMKKQMSVRSFGDKSAHSALSRKSMHSQRSKRSMHSTHKSSRHTNTVAAPEPPYDPNYADDDYDEFGDGEYDDEEEEIVMPQTEEEIRKGLHTEQVTKGFFRKKVRSIKWYSADIDKVDAGDFQAQETIDEEEGSSEYESDSVNSEEEVIIPDPWYIALGRGLLLLEKKGEETTPIKRWLRFLTWLTFVCDATAAIVTLVQFSEIQTCCGQPILNLGGINVNWGIIIRYATIFYLILILLEVYPVLRRGFPFNIVNPIIGFLITFALFFDDSYVEALAMWCIETCAVLSEFAVYRVKIRQVNMRAVEIKKLMPKTTKKKESWEDEDEYLKELHKARRRYYVLKQEQRMDQRLLQYLHVAVYMNIIMSSIVLMLILVIARNGGLCIANFDYPNPFASNQLKTCFKCTDGPTEQCEYCDDFNEVYQCYFPYS